MTRRSKAQWRQLIGEQIASDLNGVEFCKLKGLTYKTFSARKCELNTAQKNKSSFVPVEVANPKTEKPKQIAVLVNGIELKLPAELSPQRIGGIIKACAA